MTTYYAVNTETKEHIKIPNMRYKPQGVEWKVVEGDDEGWIKFEGEDNPLPYNVKCHVGNGVDWRSRRKFCSEDWDWTQFTEYLPVGIKGVDVKQQEWNGEGLPPVGTVCEVTAHYLHGKWYEMRVTAITDDHVIGYIRPDRESAVNYKNNGVEFRPIQSAEQCAEEQAVEEMLDITTAMHISDMKEAMKSLYEAGYRKTVEK